MPSYSFKNNDTGEEFEQILSMSEREKFLEQNPHIHQLPSLFATSASGTGDRIKNDDGWKENMARIGEAHPGSPIADRYTKATTKDINTRNVLRKHKLLGKN